MSDSEDAGSDGSQQRLHRPSLSRKMRRSIRKVKKSIQKMTVDDGEEETKPIHVVPERLAALSIRTGFSRNEICKIYRAFKQHCPGGAATPNDLRPAYAKLFPLGDSTKYAQVVFNTFDTNKDGLVSFGDFLTGLSLIVKGTAEEKLSWIFGLYDMNGDGHITRHEMLFIVSAIYEMVRTSQTIQRAVNRHVDRLFEKMDLNKDGVISREEFMTSCMNDQSICTQLTVFDDLW
ncbi:neuronal calcium sensor 1-like [Neodiprion pinetum]|uniref:Kv channel-interacting protein 4 n=1 Tax=Neodiprion lecontei TaxID=441921 RepID=A0A6J0B9M6_NEOLC|nr:Kv channel-interacting protein 4 [Neodiprion lecontei]XP_046412973.1 Kv channel-interacting protein 4-like [Neodiprion fabricii]XP_046467401.1 Kv channel-interacting protein 4-like [Neodiprion pinetum]XP_046627843.1 Kv channel-interacting protein 4-like [Neodiprion virginianus]